MAKKKQTQTEFHYDDVFSDLNVGSITTTHSVYDLGDFGNWHTDELTEIGLREKYPALEDAWKHYESVKKMCIIREKENNED